MTGQTKTDPVQEIQPKAHHNLRWLFVSISVGAILIALLVIQPWNFPVNASDVLNKTFAAMANVNSFRATCSNFSYDYETIRNEIEFVSPTCYHATYTETIYITELLVVDNKKYIKGSITPVNTIIQSVELTVEKLGENYKSSLTDTLSKLEKRPSQVIAGEVCVHYYGKSDPEKLDEVSISGPHITINYEDLIQILNNIRVSIYEYEFWIGKTDGRLRQIKSVYQGWNSSNTGLTTTVPTTFTVISGSSMPIQMPPTSLMFKFYDFNKPIVIEAPLDANGQLLPGWELVE